MKDQSTASPDPEASPPARVSRRTWRTVVTWARAGDWLLEGVSIGLIVAVAVGFGSFAGRRAIVGELAEDFLRRRGVEAVVEVQDVDARGFVGRVRLGPATDPDFAADRVEVLLASPPPPEGSYALRPRSILIRSPRLKARWTGERLSFGALDPLVEEFLSRPPDPTRPSPRVTIDDGALRLATPWGLVQAGGDGVLDNSRLQSLDLALRPASLKGRDFAAELRAGSARVRVRGDAADVRLSLAAARLQSSGARLQNARLRVDGRAPYPDTKQRRLDGPLQLTAALTADEAGSGGAGASRLDLELALQGAVEGPFARPAYRGRADASLAAARLRSGKAEARTLRGAARITELVLARSETGLTGRGALRSSWKAAGLASGGAALQGAAGALASDGLTFATGSDGLSARGPARLTLAADGLSSGELSARGVRVAATSSAADLRAGAGGLAASGPLQASVQARSAALRGSAELSGLDADLTTGLRLLTGGAAPVSGRATLARLTLASTPMTASEAALRFNGRAGGGGFDLQADLTGRGALAAPTARRVAQDLPVLGDNPGYAAAVARGLTGFRVEAPGLRLSSARGGSRLRVTRPVRLRGDGGALAELTPGPGGVAPFDAAPGGFRLAVSGGGLPPITAAVERYRMGADGFDADLRVRAALDASIAEGAVIEARGRASSRRNGFTFTAAECVSLTAVRLELGENDVENLSTRLCPDPQGALIRAGGSGFRVRGRFDRTSADVPFLQTRITEARGALDAAGGPAGLASLAAAIATAEAADTAPERRFHPLALMGTASLGQGRWRADLNILDAPAGVPLATAALTHDAASGRGGVAVTAQDLRFAPDALQPHDLSPLAVGLVSAVDGAVDFTGAVEWTGAGATSRGVVSTDGLSFESPAGRVIGLKRELRLSSLAPLVVPPGQTLTAERIEAFSPLTEVSVTLGLTPEAVQIQAASAGFGGGRLVLEPLGVPLAENRALSGAVRLDDVDLGELIERTGFGDKVALQAVVDGRIPFQAGPAGLRFAGGELRSVRPGRLSVSRAALGEVSSSGGPAAVEPTEAAAPAAPAGDGEGAPAPAAAPAPAEVAAPPNAIQEWAYQALENLAFDELSVAVDSRAGGRLGMIFTVKGRHDPPNPQQARVGLFDLLRGRAFQRRIPLPGGAPVNLTLDSSINFDELLATYLELQRARNLERSGPVQPDPPRSGPE